MKWEKPTRYAQRSKCKRYSVCAIGFDNGHTGFFEAWRGRAHAEGPHLIATNLPSAEEARRICEEHVRESPQPVQPRAKETRKKSSAWSDVHGG